MAGTSFRNKLKIISLFLVGFYLSSCTATFQNKWIHLAHIPSLDAFMGVQPNEGSLWVAMRFSPFLERIQQDGESIDSEKFYPLDQKEGIVSMCVSDKIWMWMSDSTLVSYEPTMKTTRIYEQFKVLPNGGQWPSCLAVKDKLIFWQYNWIVTFINSSWKIETLLKSSDRISGIAQDTQGDEWLILTNGIIYRKKNEVWDVIKKLNIQLDDLSLFTITADNVAWIGAHNKLYRWQLNSQTDPDLIINLPDEKYDWFVQIQPDNGGRVWIVANTGIWIYQRGALQALASPSFLVNESKIQGATLDVRTNRLYVASLEDIYYTDITK